MESVHRKSKSFGSNGYKGAEHSKEAETASVRRESGELGRSTDRSIDERIITNLRDRDSLPDFLVSISLKFGAATSFLPLNLVTLCFVSSKTKMGLKNCDSRCQDP